MYHTDSELPLPWQVLILDPPAKYVQHIDPDPSIQGPLTTEHVCTLLNIDVQYPSNTLDQIKCSVHSWGTTLCHMLSYLN